MFYEYEDILHEPSEADFIVEEFKDKLHEIIKDEAKNTMEEYRNAKKELRVLDMDVRSKQNQIKRLENKIKELEEQYEQTDKHDMPRKYIDKFVRDITGNFAPGDKVWVIDTNYEWDTCDKCKGKREIPATIEGKMHMVRCVNCNGDGRTKRVIKSIKPSTINNVHLKLVFKTDRVGVWTSDSVYIRGGDYAVNPKDIYRSEEEAEKVLKGGLDG